MVLLKFCSFHEAMLFHTHFNGITFTKRDLIFVLFDFRLAVTMIQKQFLRVEE